MSLAVVDLAKNFYLIHTRNEMSANSEEEENLKFKLISLSSFVTSFYSSDMYMYICLCTFLPAETLLLPTAYSYYCRLVIQTLRM